VCAETLEKWPLFGSSFFAVTRVANDPRERREYILALNKHGVHFLDLVTHVSAQSHFKRQFHAMFLSQRRSHTVKASNFGHIENFGLYFFPRGLDIMKMRPTEK
jgi:hypothetical protein